MNDESIESLFLEKIICCHDKFESLHEFNYHLKSISFKNYLKIIVNIKLYKF